VITIVHSIILGWLGSLELLYDIV